MSPSTLSSARRDREVFQKADAVYPAVGLCQHPKKKIRETDNHTVVGGEIEGRIGTIAAPRLRTAVLIALTLEQIRLRTSTPRLFTCLVSCWVQVFLYRRPLLSIFTEVFRIHDTVEAARSAPGGEAVFVLTPVVLNELLCACLLAPFASTNLRAKPAAWVYGTDASKSRASIVRTPVNDAVSRELWRLSEFAGWHSRLPSPLRVYLDDFEQRSRAAFRARGDPADSSDSEVDLSSPEPGIAPALSEGVLWDCAEVFRGDGNWSECMIAAGLRVHDGFDTRFSAAHDFCSIELFRLLVSLVLRKVVRIWHFGLPCVSWGTLRRPRVRSKYRPFGFAPSEPFTAQHNLIAIRVAFLMWLAHFNGQWASDEQPGGSVLHYLDIFQRLIREEEWTVSRWCHCSFGSPFQKPHQWLHNEPWLLALPRGCSCGRRGRHFKVEGSFTPERLALFESMCTGGSAAVYRVSPRPGQSVASFSGSYPIGAMQLMASGAVNAVAAAKRDPCGPAFRPRHVAPDWICEFIESARFHPVIAYDFARPAHINCLESRTVKTLTKLACRTCLLYTSPSPRDVEESRMPSSA